MNKNKPCKDGYTEGIWILYGPLLTSKFLNANVAKTIVAERHWIMENSKLI